MRGIVTPDDLREFRSICEKRIEELDPDRTAELALSGGTDSMTILFSMLSTDRRPHCISFYVHGVESTDIKASRYVCKYFGLELTEVKLPSAPHEVIADIKRVLPHCAVIKPTIVQCMIPWLYIYPAMRGSYMLNGLGGDDHYCNQLKVQKDLHANGEESVLKYRQCYTDDINFSGGNIKRFAEVYQKRNEDFYNCAEITDWFRQFTVRAINKPYDKYPSIAAFADFYRLGRFKRAHSSYQINSGLKDSHLRLLDTQYNRRNAKSIVAIYNDLAANHA